MSNKQTGENMKFTNRLLAAVLVLTSLGAVADTRDYESVAYKYNGETVPAVYRLYDNIDEVGYRFIFNTDSPCAAGFVKMTKTVEQNVTIFAANHHIQGCTNYRFLFKSDDLSKGWIQGKNQRTGEFRDASSYLKIMETQNIAPNLILKT
jgi:hypothetical protein